MRVTGRIKEIIDMNLANHYIPLVLKGDDTHLYPMYYGISMDENLLAFPTTGATGINEALKQDLPALAMVADREGGYEAYLLHGKARYITSESDYDLVSMMQNIVPGLPIHGAVIFEIETTNLIPPS